MTKSRSYLPRIVSWSLVALTACILPFSEQLGTRTLAQDLPKLQAFTPQMQNLRFETPAEAIEGQPVTLKLAWKDIPAATRLQPQTLQLHYARTDYQGKPLPAPEPFVLDISHQQHQIIFNQPGTQTIEVRDEQGQVWQKQTLEVKPFPASIFPRHHQEYPQLSQNPEDYHVWVNLHYNPKTHPKQRQYAQITYKGQILERLLISSGAPGHDTPQGNYKVGFKDYYPRSARYDDTPMPFWSAINMNGNEGEYGFHSLEGGGYLYLLGRPASHGCIRMSRMASVETNPETGEKYWGDRGGARWIYDRIPKHTPVSIFKQPLADFQFEDYPMYLVREAKERLAERQAKQATAKATQTAKQST